MSDPRVGGSSPWGKIQHCKRLAPGAWVVSTAGHGGIKVSQERLAAIPANYHQTPYSSDGWFEEDCDWAIPAKFHEDIKKALGVGDVSIDHALRYLED